ncbi:MAG TPA: hypothetical protein VFD53_05690 [Ilumatobacter sp.]|nr:hypothetical protein [Ilumatobacter sp.]
MRRVRIAVALVTVPVLVAGVGYAASQTLTSRKLTVLSAPAPSTGPKATALTFTDGGGNDGLPQRLDSLTVMYSETMAAPSICSTWTSGNSTNYTIDGNGVVTVTLENDTTSDGKDRLVVSVAGVCGNDFNFGSVNLADADFVKGTGPATFYGSSAATPATTPSKITWNAGNKQLTITLGTQASGTVDDVNGNRVAVYTPDPDLKSATGTSITTDTASSPSNKKLF